jgi:hypothetical protein
MFILTIGFGQDEEHKFRGDFIFYVFPTKTSYYESYQFALNKKIDKNKSLGFSLGIGSGDVNNFYLIQLAWRQLTFGIERELFDSKNWMFNLGLHGTYYSYNQRLTKMSFRGMGPQLRFSIGRNFGRFNLGVLGQASFALGHYKNSTEMSYNGFGYRLFFNGGLNVSYKFK